MIEQIEHRKALVRGMDVDPNTTGICSPWLPDATTPSESRALSPSPIFVGENENEMTTEAASLTSSSSVPLSSAPSSSDHGDGSPNFASFQSTPSVQSIERILSEEKILSHSKRENGTDNSQPETPEWGPFVWDEAFLV